MRKGKAASAGRSRFSRDGLPEHYVDSQESLAKGIVDANSRDEAIAICLTNSIALDAPLPPIETDIAIDGQTFSIDGNEQHHVFNILKGSVRIDNLTILRGLASNMDSWGGAILVNEACRLVAHNCVFRRNRAEFGIGGAIFNNGSAHISSCAFTDNSAVTGGAVCNNSDFMVISNSVFCSNKSGEGGALCNTGTLSIDCSSFIENFAESDGGALHNQAGKVAVTNCTFALNEAGNEGGAIWHGPFQGSDGLQCTTILTHVTIAHNAAMRGGGGIYVRVKKKRSFSLGRRKRVETADRISNSYCNLRNSIVAGNNSEDCAGIVYENINNLIEDGSWRSTVIGDPVLGNMTGFPPAYPLGQGSSAVNAAHPEYCLPEDQVGTSRPQGTHGDIGAYECPMGID